jgi:outer membrane protein assembly factor BamB
MKNTTINIYVTLGIVLIFIFSIITPTIIGNNFKAPDKDISTEKHVYATYHYDDLLDYKCNSEAVVFLKDPGELKVMNNESLTPILKSNGLMNSSWPMKCHDARHTSQSPYSTADNPHVEKWRFYTSSDIESSPIIDENGIIYVNSVSNARLSAVYPNGTQKWSYQAGGLLWSTPALSEDGTIYVTSWDGFLHAVYPNGTMRWKFNYGGNSDSSPAIGENGIIYLGSTSGKIHALNPNGTEKWHYQTGGWTMSNPAIGEEDIIYIGSEDGRLYAIYPNGTLKWYFSTGDKIRGHPSIAEDGTIFIPSWDDYLYAIYPNGTLRWKTHTGWGSSGSAAIANDGTIYMFTNVFRAFYPNNGAIKWSLDIGGDGGQTSPAISADGTIYTCNDDGKCIIAIHPNGYEIWRKQICNLRTDSSPVIAEDGTIYVGSSGIDENYNWYGYLHAFGAGRNLTADAGGPYSGNAEESIKFEGTVFGGILPYTYHWNFGDGNTSDIEDPSHTYARPGDYIATFTVVDGDENMSSDTANVTVGTCRPTVYIKKPENALYLCNVKVLPLLIPVIFGRITIQVEAYQEDVGINRVCFYVDYELQYTDYDEPYEWTWDERVFFNHRIAVSAKSNDGKSSSDEIDTVFKFF